MTDTVIPNVSVSASIHVRDVATQLKAQEPQESGAVAVSFGRGTLFFRNVDEVARAATMLTDYCRDQVVLPSTDDIEDARQRIMAYNKTILDYFKTPPPLQLRPFHNCDKCHNDFNEEEESDE